MVTAIAMLALGLLVLVKGADFFITSSVQVGHFLKLPSFVIGVILVGFGTSLPELVSSVMAVSAGSSEIVVGNVLGSNIFNTFAVMGVPALLGTLTIPESVIDYSMLFFLGRLFGIM